jgi:TonB family protein
MRKLLVIVFVTISYSTYSQTEKIFFLKNNGKFVTNKDSADFMRVVDQRDSVTGLYKITEFYPNSVRKLIGTASVYWPKMIWEGPSITFDKQGRKVQQVSYQNNSPAGVAYYYYPNGRIMKELDYSNVKISPTEKGKISLKYKLLNYYDSTGVQLVKDGNGYLKEAPNKKIIEEGNYVNGVREGLWKGIIVEDSTHYEDSYKKGKFVSGKNFGSDGHVITYTEREVFPKFPGGEKAFGRFVGANLKYPPEARDLRIWGRVVLTFVVEKDGTLSNIQVAESPHYSMREEALRVMRKSPRWEPGIQNGVPVKVKYTIPITFNIQ